MPQRLAYAGLKANCASNGCAWRALPDEFGYWLTIYQYFNRLSLKRFFDWLHEQLLLGKDAEVVCEDSTHCKVHQHANGSKDRSAQAVERSRGGLNTKIHAVCDALLRLAGKLVLTGGNVSDFTAAPGLTADLHDCVVTEIKASTAASTAAICAAAAASRAFLHVKTPSVRSPMMRPSTGRAIASKTYSRD